MKSPWPNKVIGTTDSSTYPATPAPPAPSALSAMKQELDDMRIKMLEMEKKVKKLELKVCGFPDAIKVSSEGRAAED